MILCKDCKFNRLPKTSGNIDCEKLCGMTDPNGYRSLAEERENKTIPKGLLPPWEEERFNIKMSLGSNQNA